MQTVSVEFGNPRLDGIFETRETGELVQFSDGHVRVDVSELLDEGEKEIIGWPIPTNCKRNPRLGLLLTPPSKVKTSSSLRELNKRTSLMSRFLVQNGEIRIPLEQLPAHRELALVRQTAALHLSGYKKRKTAS